MTGSLVQDHGIGRGELLFGLLGGAVAWTVHLMAVYAIGEWGCVSRSMEGRFLGIAGIAWLLIAVTVGAGLASAAAALVAYRSEQRLRPAEEEGDSDEGVPREEAEVHSYQLFTARSGMIMSGLFTFVIVVESVPVFFFLRGCS